MVFTPNLRSKIILVAVAILCTGCSASVPALSPEGFADELRSDGVSVSKVELQRAYLSQFVVVTLAYDPMSEDPEITDWRLFQDPEKIARRLCAYTPAYSLAVVYPNDNYHLLTNAASLSEYCSGELPIGDAFGNAIRAGPARLASDIELGLSALYADLFCVGLISLLLGFVLLALFTQQKRANRKMKS